MNLFGAAQDTKNALKEAVSIQSPLVEAGRREREGATPNKQVTDGG